MPKGRIPQPVDEAQIVADFQAGMSLAEVRSKHHIGDACARKFRAFASGDPILIPERSAELASCANEEPKEEPIFPGNPDCYHLDTYIPADRVDGVLSNLTREDAIAALLNLSPSDKAVALEFLIQRLVKTMVAEVDVELALKRPISAASFTESTPVNT